MLFGNNNVVNPSVLALFDAFPLGTRLQIGVNAGNWIGDLAGTENSVIILTDAQLFGNGGAPIEGVHSVVRVPLALITFVSEAPKVRPPKPHKKHKKGKKKAKECCKKFIKKICKVKRRFTSALRDSSNRTQNDDGNSSKGNDN